MRSSIQLKILIFFSTVIFAGFSLLAYTAYYTTEQNTRNVIKADMIEVKRNLDTYMNQYLLINNMDISEATIAAEAESISRQLSAQIGNNVDIYDLKGQKLSYSSAPAAVANKTEDLLRATKGEISYTTNFIGDRVFVSLSYPIQKSNAGIIRYYKDYTELYSYNQKFKRMIGFFTTAIFIIIFIASFIFSQRITKPIKMLVKATEKVSMGNFDIDIDTDSKDEIGNLSFRFKMMISKIKEQIQTIKNDRDKLAELQEESKLFFDNVTHELKTPITTITGYAQTIEDLGIKDDDFTRKGLKCIINETNRLNNMVMELIELSKASSRKFSYDFYKVDIGSLIKDTCEEMQIKGKKYNINIVCNTQEALYIMGDKDRLKEVLINLIDNSIKYGDVNSIVHVNAHRKQNTVFITVKDKGMGIPKEFIGKIFDPFYRVSKKGSRALGSAGLGLAIVKEIVERHNGNIEIESKLGQGTEVILQFKSEVV